MRRYPSLKAGIAGTLLVTSLLMAEDVEVPQPPSDPVSQARIEQLVKDLGHPEFARRDTASQRLAEIGSDAVWALSTAADSDDPELRVRARELLDKIAWVPPSDRKEIDRLIGILKTTRDVEEAAKAFDTLKGMGNGARKILKALFPERQADPEEMELSVRLQETTVTRGKPVAARIRLVNKGKEPLWIRPDAFLPSPSQENAANEQAAAFGAVFRQIQIVEAFGDGGQEKYGLLHVAPGGSYERDVTLDGSNVTGPGSFGFHIEYDTKADDSEEARMMGAMVLQIQAQLPGAPAQEDPEKEIHARPTGLRIEAKTGPVHVLPPLDPTPGKMSMKAALAVPEAESGKPLAFELTLKGEDPAGVRIDLPSDGKPGRRFWVALLDEKGQVIAMKTFTGSAEDGAVRTLKQGETLTLKEELPHSARPGRYHLVAGYSGTDGDPAAQQLAGMFGGAQIQLQVLQGGGVAKRRGVQARDEQATWQGEAVTPKIPVVVK